VALIPFRIQYYAESFKYNERIVFGGTIYLISYRPLESSIYISSSEAEHKAIPVAYT
jgi:hypothetical protein